jgi:hypothetical protein
MTVTHRTLECKLLQLLTSVVGAAGKCGPELLCCQLPQESFDVLVA